MKTLLLIICQSLFAVLFAQQVNTEEIPTHYRRGIETPAGYKSYEQKYSGKNLEEEKRKQFPLNSFNSGTGVWTELHPRIPRVTYFGVHFINPDTGLVVGGLGAIIKTTNGGDDWTISETNTTTLVLKVHSFNGQIVIATGYGGMILRSIDGGETFIQITSGVTFDLWGVQILNDTLGFACGLNQTLLKTTDAGLTWQTVNTGLNQHYWALDFLNEQSGMIACGGGKILRTTDGGNSWNEQQAGDASDLYAIDIIDSLHIAASGANGKNVYTTDGGTTWTQNNRLQHDELNSIKFINVDTGYTIGTYGGDSWGIRKTTNRGVTWFSPTTPNLSEWELELLPDDIGYSVGGNLWIAKTINGYDNWEGLFLNANFVDVYFTSELTGYAADGRYTGGPLYKTTDGGLTWFGLPNFPSQVFTSTLKSIIFTDSVTGFAGSAPARIIKTTDAGESWYIVNRTGLTDTIGLINRFYFINPSTGWAVTSRGGILKSTDAGENWFAQLEAGSFVIFNGIYFVNPLYGWTANEAQWPFKTTNGGDTWIQQTGSNIFATRDIYFLDSLNAYTVKILELFKTTNSGNNWFAQLNSQYVLRTFGWLTSNHGFIIGDGVYETTDSGNAWNEILELRNFGLRKFHSPKNYIGYSIGNLGLVYKYIDTTIIPVELNSFFVSIDGNNIIVAWSTSSELNNRGFEVERSTSKTVWETIGFVDGHGTTTETHSYSFIDSEVLSGKVKYRLKQIDFDGTFEYSNEIEVDVDVTPKEFVLHQNYPNPFNPTTKIKFEIPTSPQSPPSKGGEAKQGWFTVLKVYDILGNEVATLVNENKPAGTYEVEFNAEGLASGVYFYQLKTGNYIATKKMTILK